MRDHLGDAWSSFKPKIVEVWKLVKDAVGNERGNAALGIDAVVRERSNRLEEEVLKHRDNNYDETSPIPGYAQIITPKRAIAMRDIVTATIKRGNEPKNVALQIEEIYNKAKYNIGNKNLSEEELRNKILTAMGVRYYGRAAIADFMETQDRRGIDRHDDGMFRSNGDNTGEGNGSNEEIRRLSEIRSLESNPIHSRYINGKDSFIEAYGRSDNDQGDSFI